MKLFSLPPLEFLGRQDQSLNAIDQLAEGNGVSRTDIHSEAWFNAKEFVPKLSEGTFHRCQKVAYKHPEHQTY